jgi:cell division protein FtsB
MNKNLVKFIRNEYTITILIFCIWIIFLDEITVSKWMNQKINNRKIIEEIQSLDRQTIEMERILKYKNNKDSIEKYAREHYFMKRKNEVIYIFD